MLGLHQIKDLEFKKIIGIYLLCHSLPFFYTYPCPGLVFLINYYTVHYLGSTTKLFYLKYFLSFFFFYLGLYTKLLSGVRSKWARFTMPKHATRLPYMWRISKVAIISFRVAVSIFTLYPKIGRKVGGCRSSSCQSWSLWLSEILSITRWTRQRRRSVLVRW